MERIEYTHEVHLGRASIPFLLEEDYEVVGMCKNYIVFAANYGDYIQIEVLDPFNTNRNGMARVMEIELSETNHAFHVDISRIDDKYKGFGLAPVVYRYIMRKLGIVLEAGVMQSPGGRYIWAQLSKQRGIVIAAKAGRKYYEVFANEFDELESDDIEIYDGKRTVRVFATYNPKAPSIV